MMAFLLYAGFFVVIFNLVMEWLAWAVDSTITVLLIFFYLLFFIKNFRRFDAESFLYRVGEASEQFYEKFVKLFHSKENFMMGIGGILVLHLLTDVGNFIIPYIFGKKINYFTELGAGHNVIPSLLSLDMSVANTLLAKSSVVAVYALNVVAILVLLIGPAFIWYEMYTKKRIEFSNFFYGLFFAAAFVFLASPIFDFQRISSESLYGVDILTNTINVTNSTIIAVTALMLFFIFSSISSIALFRTIIRDVSVFFIETFFVYYIYMFFTDIIKFYARSIVFVGNEFILFYLILFLIITVFFYLGGMAYLVYNTMIDLTKKFI
jgi:hypothetical protein